MSTYFIAGDVRSSNNDIDTEDNVVTIKLYILLPRLYFDLRYKVPESTKNKFIICMYVCTEILITLNKNNYHLKHCISISLLTVCP